MAQKIECHNALWFLHSK